MLVVARVDVVAAPRKMRGASKTSDGASKRGGEDEPARRSAPLSSGPASDDVASKVGSSSKRPEVLDCSAPLPSLPEAFRLVEGLEFACVVLSTDRAQRTCTVRFEDGFVERDVPVDPSELRITGRTVAESAATGEGVVVAAISATDDVESENAGAVAQPVYVINQSETNVATGGGLRGIRHLRRSKTPKGESPARRESRAAAARAHSR